MAGQKESIFIVIERGLGTTFKGNKCKTDQSRDNKKDVLLDFERDGLKWQVRAEWNIMRRVMRAATVKQQKSQLCQ